MIEARAGLQSYLSEIAKVQTVEALTARTAELVAPLGAISLSANLIAHRHRRVTPGILFGRRWSAWSELYQRSGFHRDDPALRMLARTSLPFTWAEALARFPSAAAARVVDACLDFTGARDGLVVPISEPDGAALTATFSGPALDTSPEAQAMLLYVGQQYVSRGRALMLGLKYNPVCPLTPREVECLDLVRVGKTDVEIGLILGLSPRTAHNHVEAAKRKLGVNKRGAAVEAAFREGWIG